MSIEGLPDVMQVCLKGHVTTDLLRTFPERGLDHCDRCGAATLSRCPTCGRELPGAIPVPGLLVVGERRPPQHCPSCGATFPWTEKCAISPPESLTVLQTLLRRLPRTIRQLRDRHGRRPAFIVEDEHDLADLLRAVLPLHFDDVRLESRTPRYATDTRTDLVLGPDGLALSCKVMVAGLDEAQLAEQLQEDVAYYSKEPRWHQLVGFVYDPEQRLHEPGRFEAALLREDTRPKVGCVVAW
jgi:hypothetical protein